VVIHRGFLLDAVLSSDGWLISGAVTDLRVCRGTAGWGGPFGWAG
jgi:hypothetical protein